VGTTLDSQSIDSQCLLGKDFNILEFASFRMLLTMRDEPLCLLPVQRR
jgi:hypothetical protein